MKSYTKTVLICLLFVCSLQPFSPMVSAQGGGWLTGWDYRQGLTISNSTGAGTNYPVKIDVTWASDMQTDFDDLRFTDDDGETELDYWIEEYTASTSAVVWVEVADNLNSTQIIYMYYGNDAVSTTMDGEATFYMFDDWSTQSIQAAIWDITDANGVVTYSAVDANHYYVAKFDADAAATYAITTDFDASADIAVRFRANVEDTGAGNVARIGSGWAGSFGFAYFQSSGGTPIFSVYDDDGNPDNQAMTGGYDDSWIVFDVTRDGTNARLYADDVLIETGSFEPDAVSTNPAGSITCTDSEDDVYNDWFLVRKFTDTEPVAVWGVWQTINIAQFIFPVGWDPTAQFGFDMFFITLGLIMIPASTMYLVRGGRKEMSRDKVFLVLLLFLTGIGLVIGGVMP